MDFYLPVSELISSLAKQLGNRSDTPLLDAQLLVAHAAGQVRTWVLAHPEAVLAPAQAGWVQQALLKAEMGMPLPYILGAWEFFGLRFSVNPSVLIPRPETENLVEAALSWCKGRQQPVRAIDVGAGSGCIAVSLAIHAAHTRWIASDISQEALKVAYENISAHSVQGRVRLLQTDLLSTFPSGVFDLICANLPYIPSATLRRLPLFGSEPLLALDGGTDGLTLIRELLAQASTCLAPVGMLLAEIEASLGAAAVEIAERRFPSAQVQLRQDYAGRDRLLVIETR